MTSNTMGDCCIRGVVHEGEAVGEYKDIGGNNYYLSYPEDKESEHAILFICDAFGWEFINNRLLADSMAKAGYLVVMPDLFKGDPVPVDAFSPGFKFDVQAWLGKHAVDHVDPIIEASIKAMREELGVKKIGAVGYCFGGKYVVRFLADRGVSVGFVAHPSLVEKEELEAIKGPLSIAAAEIDQVMSAEKRHETEAILAKLGQPYQVYLYGAAQHGFAVRCDLKDKKLRFAKESAFVQAIRWFDEWLKE